jgi:hypothetical protein
MWASMFYLFIGNIIIGIVEGLVLRRILPNGKRSRSIVPESIVANFASAWAGAFGLAWCMSNWSWAERAALDAPRVLFWTMAASSFAVSVVVEWPVMWMLARRSSLKAIFAANLASYALLVPFFIWASLNNVSDWQLRPVGQHPLIPGCAISFVARDGSPRSIALGPIDPKRRPEEVESRSGGRAADLNGDPDWEASDFGFMLVFDYSRQRDRSRYFEMETPLRRPRQHDMSMIDGRYLCCVIGPYVVLMDPEKKAIYRLSEGSAPVVHLTMPRPAPPTSQPAPPPPP